MIIFLGLLVPIYYSSKAMSISAHSLFFSSASFLASCDRCPKISFLLLRAKEPFACEKMPRPLIRLRYSLSLLNFFKILKAGVSGYSF